MSATLLAAAMLSSLPAAGVPAVPLPPGVQQVRSVEGITEYRLPNGMQILLAPDASKPTTTVNLVVKVGSKNENSGETGMAHLLEHMMFKGTPTTRNADAEFSRRGIQSNASTSLDRTNYFGTFSANEGTLRWKIGWLADAMIHSFIARKDLDTEMTVVRNEMERGENSPFSILSQRMTAIAYQWHGYGRNTIGARADVENVDIPRLQAFYHLYYQPDNATLVISGRFAPAVALKTIAQTFGRIPAPKRKLPTFYTIDPVQDGDRSVTLRRSGGVPIVAALYHQPAAANPDYAASTLLNLVMADEPSGRLHKALVEKGLAAKIGADDETLHDPGHVMFEAVLEPQQSVDAAREALLSTLEGVADKPVTEEEFERAKTAWLKSWEMGFADAEHLGLDLTEWIAAGDWRLLFLLRDRVSAATRDDVQRVALQTLLRDNRTLGIYVPTPAPHRSPAPQFADLASELKTFKPSAASTEVERFDATPENIEARVKRSQLGNGMRLVLLPKATRGRLVNATLLLRLGDEASLTGRATTARFVAALLDRGTQTLTRAQLQDKFDQLHSQVSIGGAGSEVQVGIISVKEHFDEVLELVADMLQHPALPDDQLEELRRISLTGIEARRMEPGAIVQQQVRRSGQTHPRGHPHYVSSFDEQVEDIRAMQIADLREFHAKFYGTQAASLAVVGDFDAASARAVLQSRLGNWTASQAYHRIPDAFEPRAPASLSANTPDKANANYYAELDFAMTDTDPDYPALLAANQILGGSTNARLWKRIRDKEGLSYGVGSRVAVDHEDNAASWTFNASYAPENRDRLLKAVSEEIKRLLKDGASAAEVSEAREGMQKERTLARSQDATLASQLAALETQQRNYMAVKQIEDASNALTVDQVNAALRRVLAPEHLVTGVAGDFSKPQR
jgi:zinc protease